MIYFILCTGTGHIKIGKTTGIKKRLAQLQTGSASPLLLLATAQGYTEVESALHLRLHRRRVRGEYFDLRAWELAWALLYTRACPLHPRACNALKWFWWLPRM